MIPVTLNVGRITSTMPQKMYFSYLRKYLIMIVLCYLSSLGLRPRKFLQRLQTEPLEEAVGRSVQEGSAERFRAADHLHESLVHEPAERARRVGPAHRVHVGTEQRLAPRDHREHLELRLREALLAADLLEPLDPRRVLRAGEQPDAAGDLLDVEAGRLRGVARLQLADGGVQLGAR